MAVSRDILVAPAGTLVEITVGLFFLISIAAALPDYCCYQPLPGTDVCHAQTDWMTTRLGTVVG